MSELTSVDYFAYAVATWSTGTAVSLVGFPRLITTLLLPYEKHSNGEVLPKTELNGFEKFLATQSSISLVAAAYLLLQLTGSLSSSPIRQPSPYRIPSVGFATLALLLSSALSFYADNIGNLGKVHCLPTALLSLWGVSIMIFGEDFSTKRSSFPFKNTEAKKK
ncbi:hypothetical protein E3P81_03652 [Wallemia ichthyophaga]|nr:hypothetical protein E3P91_03334 [Wallemia ichthyophaga]TIA88099.1 hypothetical protein E3P97_03660 [Wallemia ichthyophaga]TIB05512.1 hypothetical protein E3P96_01176 [Wallemia ichthyophaga]TIB28691.1 hypothetical protein E3P85_03526 [Wallemia ichthyophaga]TIB44184.1 hypothetical protein E3P82_03657 [Wallemia ichthyophaga]